MVSLGFFILGIMKISDLKVNEYDPYYQGYINAAGERDLLESLCDGITSFERFVKQLPSDKMHYAYARNKWTLAEVLLHVVDAERIFAYRALRFARKDMTPLAGFEQDEYVPASNANKRSKQSILDEFVAVRKATVSLFRSFDEPQLKIIGTASNSPMSVAALGFICCGHQNHHSRIILEKYLD